MIHEFHYQVNWRSSGVHPGHHRSAQHGGGYEFAGHAPLTASPDPRNLDVRATLHDTFGQLMVRTFRQRSSIPVYLVADLSASMGFRGTRSKIELLAEFTASAAYSAYRTGDFFGFFGCDDAVRRDLFLPLRWHKGAAPELLDGLKNFQPQGSSSDGLQEVVPHLGRQKALVFLVSDFHFSLERLDLLLQGLTPHDVVPVVLWDSAEYVRLPFWGLINFEDPETRSRKRFFMRPTLRQKIRASFAKRRDDLERICTLYGRRPFFLIDRFDPDALTGYFYLT
ncbi:uncharacterized protein sS8_4687 [Methylocaldum marinum]|uniref:DUF58 domain-containing protein n=1 Tax=Methylocaldum marinum TaxID=1432792 RepID=A0A250KYC8_9GAMM|nr:DUF58 domain-containing protein [Methylocaldum marinum]BBA36617.1 uncharacterized protein sS8_4687 [Methylocaldum marinum]